METATTSGNPVAQLAARALNTPYKISDVKPALVCYSVELTITSSIGSSQNGDVLFETADDSAFTINVQTMGVHGGGEALSVAAALTAVTPRTGPVIGFAAPGKWCRLRSAQNTGSPSFNFRYGFEVLFG